MDIITYALLSKRIKSIISGVSNVEVNGTNLIFEFLDGTSATMRFPTPKDGVSVTDIDVNADNQIVFTMSDGSEFTSGKIPTVKGEPGVSPTIIENADNTDKIYKLDIETIDGKFTTPNLRGANGTGEENVIESIKVNGVTQTIAADKSVDITVPTVDVDKNYVDTEVSSLKSDVSTNTSEINKLQSYNSAICGVLEYSEDEHKLNLISSYPKDNLPDVPYVCYGYLDVNIKFSSYVNLYINNIKVGSVNVLPENLIAKRIVKIDIYMLAGTLYIKISSTDQFNMDSYIEHEIYKLRNDIGKDVTQLKSDISANAQSIIDIKNQIGNINTLLDTINGEVI